MSRWPRSGALDVVASGPLEITTLRRDDTLGSPRTICVVPHCDDLYVGRLTGPPPVGTAAPGHATRGHIRAHGANRDVTFVDAAPDISDELDAVDRDKRRYSPRTLDRITRPAARSTIIELIPR